MGARGESSSAGESLGSSDKKLCYFCYLWWLGTVVTKLIKQRVLSFVSKQVRVINKRTKCKAANLQVSMATTGLEGGS